MTSLRFDASAPVSNWPATAGTDPNRHAAPEGLTPLDRAAGTDVQSLVRQALDRAAGDGKATDWSWAGTAHTIAAALQSRPPAADPDAERVKDAFKREFAAKAGDKEAFDALMKQVYGDKYDKALAEQYRQQALRGDFSFLPEVKFVDHDTLRGGKGAYNEAEGVVYIDRDLAARDPAQAAQVYVEEAGAHLDAKLNTRDTQGDEGEMFRRLLGGEHLSQREIDAIRNDDDRGRIVVDGKEVEVEFWFGEDIVDAAGDAVDAVGDAASDVVDGVSDAGSYVFNAAGDALSELGDAAKSVGEGLIGAGATMVKGFLEDMVVGTLVDLANLRFADAFESLVRGADRVIFQGPRKFVTGAIDGIGHALKSFTHYLPDSAGKAVRDVIDRGVDSVRTVASAAIDVVRNTAMMPARIVARFEQDIGAALKAWARGDLGGGFERLGLAFVNPVKEVAGTFVDDAMIVAQGAVNVAGNVTFTHDPARPLSDAEKAYLKSVYGDSIDLDEVRVHRGNLSLDAGLAAHTVGNDIYLPDEAKYWNADGTLTQEGKLLLVHESFHAWQAQHQGNGYIHDALLAQVSGIAATGNRNAGYDFIDALRSGKPFNEWNPEQQAKFFETMARARDAKLPTARNKDGVEVPTMDLDGDGRNDASYDLNRDGRIDGRELQYAFYDANGDGQADGGNDGNRNDAFNDSYRREIYLSNDDAARAFAMWDTLRADLPDSRLA